MLCFIEHDTFLLYIFLIYGTIQLHFFLQSFTSCHNKNLFSNVCGCAFGGIYAQIVRVETDAAFGIPSIEVVGVPGSVVKESRERVRIAIRNTGYTLRQQKILINLSPAGVRKDGTGLDLPIAIGILLANELIKKDRIPYLFFIGELSLNGEIMPVRGVLPSVCAAREAGMPACIVPVDNLPECAEITDIQIFGAKTLRECCEFINGRGTLTDISQCREGEQRKENKTSEGDGPQLDFLDVSGQDEAKRAALVAASGMHNIAYIGPPGSGKTMIARRLAGILPSLTYEESLELTKIYSAAGLLTGSGLMKKRPFRMPGTKITLPAMLGGGADARPGEVTLADQGVLFLDEMPEFDTRILEALRGPLQDGFVRVTSLRWAYTFPARLLLAASMNPDNTGEGEKYLTRISRPLWDRFDIGVRLKAVDYANLKDSKTPGASCLYTTSRMQQAAEEARERQLRRFRGSNIHFNSQMGPVEIRQFCRMDSAGEKLIEKFYRENRLSVRGYHRVLKTARTIADLSGSEEIREEHLIEAMSYRSGIEDREGRVSDERQ